MYVRVVRFTDVNAERIAELLARIEEYLETKYCSVSV